MLGTEQGVIYLSFDDGPDPRFTPRILDLLDLYQLRASFFVVGETCERYPALLKRIHRQGHAVGNHSYSHCHPWLISNRRARQEVRRAYRTIADICAEPPRLFRPPHGRKRTAMLREARALGMETMLWTRSAIDWGILARADSIARRLAGSKSGDILLCHDAGRSVNRPDLTLTALPTVIEKCHSRQLRFAGLDELLLRAPDSSKQPPGPPASLSRVQSV